MSSRPLAPHFDLPFRLGREGAAVVEQDTLEDLSNCITAIVSTHVGWRDEVPGFGIPDLAMRQIPLGMVDLHAMIATQEPRAILFMEERPDLADELITYVNIGVGKLGARGEDA